jgi:aminoglycoside phosphotransferase (APT) family kinase protein
MTWPGRQQPRDYDRLVTGDRHDVEAVRAAVRTGLPGQPARSVTPLGEGLDHICYDIDGELIVRAAKRPDPDALRCEMRLLTAVATVSSLPVPRPLFDVDGWCTGYRRLPGVPALELPPWQRLAIAPDIAVALGGLLNRLHSTPVSRWAGLVGTDRQPLVQWRREAAGHVDELAGVIPPDRRAAISDFLTAEPPAERYRPVFSHNDLGIEHVLVDPARRTVTGIIDWSDAAIVDPAGDFGLIYRDLGPEALETALRGYRAVGGEELAALRQRAGFHARCRVFEDLRYGVETGRDRYVAKSLAALDWLFPA